VCSHPSPSPEESRTASREKLTTDERPTGSEWEHEREKNSRNERSSIPSNSRIGCTKTSEKAAEPHDRRRGRVEVGLGRDACSKQMLDAARSGV
jgi:hypothetical protein